MTNSGSKWSKIILADYKPILNHILPSLKIRQKLSPLMRKQTIG